MTIYACWAIVEGTGRLGLVEMASFKGKVYLGQVDAKSEEEAIEIADYQLPMPSLGSDVEFDIVDYEVVE